MGKVIKVNKTVNRLPIQFEKEIYIRAFKEIIYKFNQSEDLEGEVFFSLAELRNNLGLQNKYHLNTFLDNFHHMDTRKECFSVLGENWTIRGGMFTSKTTEDGVGFMLGGHWKEYFYSKLDIELWYKIQSSRSSVKKELEKKEAKEKLMQIMTDTINTIVKGKYNQRLLSLLNQFKSNGIFIMLYKDFKEVLEIPKSYRASDIDNQILNPCKTELLKADIKITKIEKLKKGRSIDQIKIFFKDIGEVKPNKIKTDDSKAIKYKNGGYKTGTISDLSDEQREENKKRLKEMIKLHK